MKRQTKRPIILAELIETVAQYARNDAEVSAVVADLINRGIVRFNPHYHDHRKRQ